MGQGSIITFPDGHIFDIDSVFPSTSKNVLVTLSAGIESTILTVLLIRKYGLLNVTAVTGVIGGRRRWEHKKAQSMATRLGIKSLVIDGPFQFMNPTDISELIRRALKKQQFDTFFNGAAKLWFNPTIYNKETVKQLHLHNMFLPFIDLQKKHTIKLYEELGVEWLLDLTHSCTENDVIHCGVCSCCLERHLGFMQLGMRDPTVYKISQEKIDKLCNDPLNYRRNW